MQIAGTEIELTRPVQYRYVDHVYGELMRPLAVVPPVAVELPENRSGFRRRQAAQRLKCR